MSATSDLLARLRRHYIRKPSELYRGGVFLPEVNCPADWPGTRRRCDALWVDFTRAHMTHSIEGHEVKVSRSDWLAELADPTKADAWARHCHRWWLVVPHRDIVKDGELPDGWGLMAPSGQYPTRMDVVVPARVNRDPEVTAGLLLEVAKKVDGQRADEEVARKHAQEETKSARDALQSAWASTAGLTHRQRLRLEMLDRLEKSLGMTLADDGWDDSATPGEVGAALAMVRDVVAQERHVRDATQAARRAHASLTHAATQMQRAIDGLTT